MLARCMRFADASPRGLRSAASGMCADSRRRTVAEKQVAVANGLYRLSTIDSVRCIDYSLEVCEVIKISICSSHAATPIT